ncbi:DEAD/DEAH box helicase [Desulfoglaeba alkanexedens]|jgi:ATP-dependent Lhr-like helicase|uniref:DEAD/DEAH box helicase n=1 Tax=Desulfoglaeba alkanexedens ALDC TaxID=980445 RepID=A0A4P8L2S7_9BACT|nr:DEAD/DEAH box helicase [Desulfoglaeba alkanexedens]QCQ21265.1 DEAD/DEAH box helicase [Desulfoglaeba alkanexedens ALDC]
MSESIGFNKLHKGVQKWIWSQKWASLRDIQEEAIEPVLDADCDIVISASTAAGKTEAAFLPACSKLIGQSPDGVGILYISPLKALINDQYRRLQGLCEILGISVTPWHGDVLRSVKIKQRKNPNGILLITPESLESLLLNQGSWCSKAFKSLCYIIVDEFHAFLGTERGCQLQSLMHRLEFLIQRTIPRIALSATLGDMKQVADSLRPNKRLPCKIIESTVSHSDLKIQLRGYLTPAQQNEETESTMDEIIGDLYKILRGKSHLVFANSRARTEEIAAKLSDLCVQSLVPNEFFPHHGSLSKEIRESLEARLQKEKLPTTAVCTMTLELGIDIGSVDSIAQVTSPHSVASLRQRLGRSGRRGEPSVLRLFIPEDEITVNSHLLDRLRVHTVQCIAMINLLLKKWYEPASLNQYHFSTLVQQTLSVIGQYGGVRAQQLWALLCETGPFSVVDQSLFAIFLRGLGENDLITQTADGQLVLGYKGEKIVEHYTFYTAFNTPEEYRLEYNGKAIGTVPIDKPLVREQHIIFAGKRWEVLFVDDENKLIGLKTAKGGKPPKFSGDGLMVHDIVRQEMRRVYSEKITPVYLNDAAKSILKEGIDNYHALNLDNKQIIQAGSTVHALPWLGDQTINTITVLLRMHGLSADCFGGIIDIRNTTINDFFSAVKHILSNTKVSPTELASLIPNTIIEKHDPVIPKELRDIGYGARSFNVDAAYSWINRLWHNHSVHRTLVTSRL